MPYRDERTRRAVLGLNEAQLCTLTAAFEQAQINHYQSQNHVQRQGSGSKGKLVGAHKKVEFCLYYLKHYPSYDLLGHQYGLARSSAYEALHRHLPLLLAALAMLDALPAERFDSPQEMKEALEKKKVDTLIIDCTERPHCRPRDEDAQSALYSGKKGTHTIKNTVICDQKRFIHFLGMTTQGQMHDFELLRLEFDPRLNWFSPFACRVDLGYLGFEQHYPAQSLQIPFKRPKGGTLTPCQRATNRTMARARIVVEHAISGIKRFACLTHRFRGRANHYVEHLIMRICAGLWNLHLQMTA